MHGRLRVACFILMGLSCTLAYAVVPESVGSEAYYNFMPAVATAVWVAAALRCGGGDRRARWYQAFGLLLTLGGELVYWWCLARSVEPPRSLTDPLFLAGTVVSAMALARRVRATPRDGDQFERLDVAIVVVAGAAVLWLALVEPVLADRSVGTADRLWALASPVADVVLFWALARTWFSLAVTTRAERLLHAGWALFLLGDVAFQLGQHHGSYAEGSATDLTFMVAYTLIGAAAIDPGATAAHQGASRGAKVGLRRLLIVSVAALLPPAVVLVGVAFVRPVSVGALAGPGAATLLTFVLTIIRMSSVVVSVESRTAEAGEARLHALVEHSTDVIAVVAVDGTARYLSPAFAAVLGRDPRDHLGRPITAIAHPDDAVTLATHVVDTAVGPATTASRFETRLQASNGSTRAFEVVASRLSTHEEGEGVALTMRDITERKALSAQLSHQAFHDSLTGLPNRARFSDCVDEALRRSRGRPELVAVAFVDLDDFKAVNDGLGHGAGDTLLRSVADRIARCIRPADIAARLGGDEFAILLDDSAPGADRGGAERVVQRILASLRAPVRVDGMELGVVASIGLAWAEPGSTTVGLLRDADIAMYEAKRLGKGRICAFDPTMRQSAADRLALQRDIAGAVDQDQLRVVYQPIVDLRTGLVTEAEALLRWHHPDRGEVPPSTFIPVAERTGVVDRLGEWTLRHACTQAAATGAAVSVNASAVQLAGSGFLQDVSDALVGAGLPASRLTIEVTETALMADTDAASVLLGHLREIGVKVAIDDFGTGYCSLSYLHRFAVDVVKIDRAFVSDLDGGGRGDVLVRAILQMAGSLGVPKVVAEGIETEAQLDRLVALGCTYGQGFLLSRPLERGPYEDLLASHRREAGAIVVPPALVAVG